MKVILLLSRVFKDFVLLIFFGGAIYTSMVSCADTRSLNQKDKPEFLVVRGFFDEKGSVSLNPLYTVGDSRFDPPDGKGPYTIELQDESGSLLATYAFKTEMLYITKDDGTERQTDSGLFGFCIPFNDHAQELNVKKGSKVLWSIKRSANTPVVSIKKPVEGAAISGKIGVEWTGFDADGDNLYYLLEYSNDEGVTWESLPGLFKENSMLLDTTMLTASKSTTLGIICTDGFNTTKSIVNVVLSTPLKILNALPNDKDTDITLQTYIFVIFGSNIKKGDINEKTFLLLEGGENAVAGEVSYIDDIMRATFVPKTRLRPNTSYTARIVAGIKDAAGNTLESNYDWSFTTEIESQ